MTQEEKELLLKDLSGRLPYGVKIKRSNCPITLSVTGILGKYVHHTPFYVGGNIEINNSIIEEIKPYLRPIYFISEEEINEIYSKAKPYIIESIKHDADSETPNRLIELTNNFMVEGVIVDEFHKRHIDYSGLIEKGLAIAVTEENNPYKYE